jgi:hypothetical protein
LCNPGCPAQGGLVGAGVTQLQSERLCGLLHERGFADLARAGHDLDEAARLAEPGGEYLAVSAPEGGLRFAHCIE